MINDIASTYGWAGWVIIGFILMFLELLDGQFILFGIGLVTLIIGVIDYFFPHILLWQELFLYGGLILLFFLIWWKTIRVSRKERMKKYDNYSEKIAIVTKDIKPYSQGKIEFNERILGSKVWNAIADEEIKKGEKVKIVEIIGQIMKVKKV